MCCIHSVCVKILRGKFSLFLGYTVFVCGVFVFIPPGKVSILGQRWRPWCPSGSLPSPWRCGETGRKSCLRSSPLSCARFCPAVETQLKCTVRNVILAIRLKFATCGNTTNKTNEIEVRGVFTNIPNLSLILVIKFMTFILVKIGPNLVFTKHVLARTVFLILS